MVGAGTRLPLQGVLVSPAFKTSLIPYSSMENPSLMGRLVLNGNTLPSFPFLTVKVSGSVENV